MYLETIDTSIKKELKYFSHQNFIGKPINGYQKNVLIVTEKAALALHRIQQIVLKEGYSLKIFDAYRPQQAVDHFVKWASVLEDTLMKQKYYPRIPKSKLFQLGYIASKSGHSRGSTVDLTLVNIETNQELDMGSPYDFFGNESHPHYKKNSRAQLANRLFLRKVMLENGFKPYENEWWHFTLLKEPFPTTYFNFPVK
ncbi:M15 family metallopeptidase [Polaribacter sp. HL-MS24]|uniref:M15 family metallopeptidase n=1 Tax=Polaribacter sp. HL-MS24 TaxID=3077735 RepID=UPI0029344105|nr:M15 family metallopeptidase [Polaribacter sp. HL-MS24]WOC39736.1 M15 family metallopeptidase [Polaribacter sp. HL-MS24]